MKERRGLNFQETIQAISAFRGNGADGLAGHFLRWFDIKNIQNAWGYIGQRDEPFSLGSGRSQPTTPARSHSGSQSNREVLRMCGADPGESENEDRVAFEIDFLEDESQQLVVSCHCGYSKRCVCLWCRRSVRNSCVEHQALPHRVGQLDQDHIGTSECLAKRPEKVHGVCPETISGSRVPDDELVSDRPGIDHPPGVGQRQAGKASLLESRGLPEGGLHRNRSSV